ncbi:hypothetical protein DP42_5409 [Burkholderia pseudomallei]|nr:hypothetical protein DP42_5409 [Burkholderia pseudomallei]
MTRSSVLNVDGRTVSVRPSTLLVLGVVGPAAGTYCSCEVVRVTVMLGILKDSNLNFVNSKTK